MKHFITGVTILVLAFLVVSCAPSNGAATPVKPVTLPTPTPAPEDPVDIVMLSNQIPACLAENTSFEITVKTTFRRDVQQSSVSFTWRRVANSPDIEVLNLDQNRKFILPPLGVASMTLTVNLVSEDGQKVPKQMKAPMFRFTNIDGQGRACFDWVRP